jgi:GNAT superfamily N-acetyltransferase
MEIKNFTVTQESIKEFVNLWNEVVSERNFYKPHTPESMQALLFNNPEFSEKGAFGAYENGKLIGFGCGFVRRSEMDKPEVPANLNSILVKKEYRNRGVGKALLDNVENYFRSFNKKAARFVFLDPVNWPWYIPNTDKHDIQDARPCLSTHRNTSSCSITAMACRESLMLSICPCPNIICRQQLWKKLRKMKPKESRLNFMKKAAITD